MYTKDSEDTCKLGSWCADKKTLQKHDSVILMSMHESEIVLNKHVWADITAVSSLYVNNM